jgi:transcriptional regulator with XRE-family HTH domain
MPGQSESDSSSRLDREISDLILRATTPEEIDRLRNKILDPANLPDVNPQAVDDAIRQARIALRISKGELTLGKYLAQLRIDSKLTRPQLASSLGWSSDVVGEIESDKTALKALDVRRLARMALELNAIKRIFLSLVELSLSAAKPTTSIQPRLTRLERSSSFLESERAVRQSHGRPPSEASDQEFLDALLNAFDEEQQIRQA